MYVLYRYEDFKTRNELRHLFDVPAKTGMIELLEHNNGWRDDISPDFSYTIENICFPAMDELGYKYLYGEELRDPKEVSFEKLNEKPMIAASLLSGHNAY